MALTRSPTVDQPTNVDSRRTQDESPFEGPSPRQSQDYVRTEPWCMTRMVGEFVESFEELSDITRAVAMVRPASSIRIVHGVNPPALWPFSILLNDLFTRRNRFSYVRNTEP